MKVPQSSFVTERPVAVLMVFVAVMVFGFFSFTKLPVTLMPELSYPTLTVRTEYAGAAPEEVENDISRPIEEALGVIGGINRISSISRAGVSDVVLEFVWGTDMSDATQETLEKLDLVFLPEDAERPLILHFDPSLDPIMELSLSGEGNRFTGEAGLRRLRRLADLQIKRALEPIPGVAAVRVRGGLEEEIHVLLDEDQLKRSGLAIQSVIDRLSQENINLAGGTVKEGRSEYMVRTLNEYENLGEIENTVVFRDSNKSVRIADLGRVERSHKEREIITNTGGAESVQIDIYKEADANMVALAKRVIQRVGDIPTDDEVDDLLEERADKRPLATELFLEEGARLEVVADRSTFIESSIDEVKKTAFGGGILAVIVLFLFLKNFKTTAIIAFSIPMSLLITFAPLNLFGVSLNIMSLGGLALGIGMLVDSSIVVLESIFRCQEEGDKVKPAAVRGTLEVRGAVIASTLTSIAVFFPMVFVEGIAGQAFGDLGLAVVISLLASVVVAIFFIPMLASRTMPSLQSFSEGAGSWRNWWSLETLRKDWRGMSTWVRLTIVAPLYVVVRGLVALLLELGLKIVFGLIAALVWVSARWIIPALVVIWRFVTYLPLKGTQATLDAANRMYPSTVRWTLRNPIAMVAVVLLTGWLTYRIAIDLESELLPEVRQGEFTFEASLPVGTPLEQTAATLKPVEAKILQNMQDIQTLLVTYGYDVTNAQRSDEGEHSARFKVILEKQQTENQPWYAQLISTRDNEAIESRVVERLRGYFNQIPDLDVRVVRPVLFSATTPIEVEVQGDNLQRLKDYAQRAGEIMTGLRELADVEVSLRRGAPEIQVVYDRDKIVQYDLNIGQVARQVRDMVKGNEATRFNMQDRRIPILVRLQEDERDRLADIRDLVVNPGSNRSIPLNAVAELTVGEGPSEVRRIDGQRVALINANLGDGSLAGAASAIETNLVDKIQWPEDMDFVVTGQNAEWEKSRNSLFTAMLLSIFLVYVIMAAQFESLIHPFIIMFTIPLAFFGTVLGLKLLGYNLSIVVFLGMIMLAGIVVNNAIVMVDYINQLRRRGEALQDAIVNAGSVRLRPILMTTATTVLGLFPMALGLGDGAEIRTPMAIAVITGLLSSTVLTLLVIPTIYYITESFFEKVFKRDTVSVDEPPQSTAEVTA